MLCDGGRSDIAKWHRMPFYVGRYFYINMFLKFFVSKFINLLDKCVLRM